MNVRIKGLLIGGCMSSFLGFLVYYLYFGGRLISLFGESSLAKLISDGVFLIGSIGMVCFAMQGLWQFISGKDVFAYLFEDKSKEEEKSEKDSSNESCI